ncbi:MAG: hypothetical protein ACRD4O_13110, partial [Bryobacteraceae bacterium]
ALTTAIIIALDFVASILNSLLTETLLSQAANVHGAAIRQTAQVSGCLLRTVTQWKQGVKQPVNV